MPMLISVLVLLACLGLVVYLWIKIANSERGERYLKQRMQGPFVPLDKDENK